MSETKEKSFYEFINEYMKEFIPKNIKNLSNSNLHKKMLSQLERSLINTTMEATNDNQSKAALILGLSRATLRKKIKILKIIRNAKD